MMIRTSLVAVIGTLIVGCGTTITEPGGTGTSKAPISGTACSTQGESVDCGTDGKSEMSCGLDSSNTLTWSACAVPDCSEGESRQCSSGIGPGTQNCERNDSGEYAWGECVPSSSASTPLLFSFDGSPATLTDAKGSFDLNATMSVRTAWPTAATPWLALDRNHNGQIDDGGELFGSATKLSVGTLATNGFAALADLDANHDGVISAADPAFSSLVVWSDLNQDRKSQPNELRTLSEMGIESINLGFSNHARCDERGNCEIETSSFVYRDTLGGSHTGRIADVHLIHE